MRKISILHIIGGLNVGGAEKSLLLLLKNIDRNQFNPIIITMFSDVKNDFFYNDFRNLGIPVYSLHLKSWRDYKTFLQFKNIVQKHKIDISHSHYGLLEFYGPLFSRLAGIKKCVYTKHNLRQKTGYLYKIQRIILNKILISRICSISKTVTRFLITNEYADNSKITLIYNPIDIPKSKGSEKSALKREFNIPENRFIIGNTNRYDPVKGFELFYRVIKELCDRKLNVHAIVMGSGSAKKVHEDLINTFQIKKHVDIIPFQKDMQKIYPMLDCFLITSKHTEGFGMTIIEAMSNGIPVIGLNVGCIPEIVKHNVTGLCPFPAKYQDKFNEDDITAGKYLAESIEMLIKDKKRYQQFSEQSRQHARNYDTKIFTKKIENIYLDLM